MSDEGKDDVGKIIPDAEGKITADKEGKYPEVVPWSQYVGIKESLGKKLDTAKEQVTSLEEKLKSATSAEDVKKIRDELEETKGKLKTSSEELEGIKDKSVSEKRELLIKRGVSEDKVKDVSEKELDAIIGALGDVKPAPDLGGGTGGAGELKGSPMELARQAYNKGK